MIIDSKKFDFEIYLKKLLLTIFTNNFMTMLLGISLNEIGKEDPFSRWDWGPKNAVEKSLISILLSTVKLNTFISYQISCLL